MLSTAALANPVPYVGAGLGIVTNTSSSVAKGSVATPFGRYTFAQPGNFRGVPVNVFAGVGSLINQNFYIGGEVNGTIATGEIESNNGLRTTYAYGASVIPGLMLSDHTMAYARAGVVRTRFTSANETRTGGQIGLGLQTSVTQNIDVRGEYDFTAYGSFNNGVGRISAPRSDAFNLALLYKIS